MNIYLVSDAENYGQYERWWEVVVIAESPEEAKEITYRHPEFATDTVKEGAVFTKVNSYNEYPDVRHWSPFKDQLKVVLLGVSDSKEKGIVTGFNGGS